LRFVKAQQNACAQKMLVSGPIDRKS